MRDRENEPDVNTIIMATFQTENLILFHLNLGDPTVIVVADKDCVRFLADYFKEGTITGKNFITLNNVPKNGLNVR